MSLKQANTAATFESEGEDGLKPTPTADAAAAETATTSVAVATPKTSALAVTAKAVESASVLQPLENALVVEFDSLPRIAASNGKFTAKEGGAVLGEVLTLQLLSYQYTWCCSPSDADADMELVKYGDNATTAHDGTNFAEHLASLKAQNFDKAKLAHRVTLVGELLSVSGKAGVGEELVGNLVQIDLPDTGRKSFGSHTLQASFAVGKGRKTVDEVQQLKLTAEVTKIGKIEFTKVVSGFVG